LSLAFSCREEAIKTERTEVNGIKLDLLFEKDGCKVYRFYDGQAVYWSDCRGNIEYDYKSGKATYKQQTINH
ncbi:hypothetical protein, partial [Sphingobacterium sp.]|uniref:hypothetical protein n=1 Tax=Sphingobacterium sp. TaxID=341027 RepID=UPI00289FC799